MVESVKLTFLIKYGLGEVKRSWKGYPFELLNELNDDNYIVGSRRAKSVYLPMLKLEQP